MDLLDNIATELGFEFHLYIVRDELFGAKYRNFKDWIHTKTKSDGIVKSNDQQKSNTVLKSLSTNNGGSAGGGVNKDGRD